jgi:hypothetical protein
MAIAGCLVASLSSAIARAGVTYVEPSGTENPTVIRMTVTPAAESAPAFKYRLLYRDLDLTPGNAAPFYYRALLELPNEMRRARKDIGEEEFDNWCIPGSEATPIDKLPLDRVRATSARFNSIIDDRMEAAHPRRDCDWQLNVEELRGPNLVRFLLPEFQSSRELSRAIGLRTRLAIAEHRYDDALAAMRINYRLGTDTAKAPFLISGLVGLAEAGVTNSTVAELIAAPGSPNLYWALTELPQPMIDLRPAAKFEMEIGPRIYPLINNAETTHRAPDEWNRLYKQTVRDMAAVDNSYFRGLDDIGADLSAAGFALVGYSHAKDRLIADGMDREKVEAMSVGQVMAIYSERIYRQSADGFESLWYVPFWDVGDRARALQKQLEASRPLGAGVDREVLPIATSLLPAIQQARAAQVRLDREIAALTVIEALRMYAAEHDGNLPMSLDKVTRVPLPLNPATGKPFAYHVEGATAVLELPPSDGIPGINRRYEITMASKGK